MTVILKMWTWEHVEVTELTGEKRSRFVDWHLEESSKALSKIPPDVLLAMGELITNWAKDEGESSG